MTYRNDKYYKKLFKMFGDYHCQRFINFCGLYDLDVLKSSFPELTKEQLKKARKWWALYWGKPYHTWFTRKGRTKSRCQRTLTKDKTK